MNFFRQYPCLSLILLCGQIYGKAGSDFGINAMRQAGSIANQYVPKILNATEKTCDVVKAAGINLDNAAKRMVEAAENIGINTAKITSEAAQVIVATVEKASYIAWAGIATVAYYTTSRLGIRIYDRYNERRKEKDLRVAKQLLLGVLVKNARNKEGLFGFPEGCENEASALSALPGGINELEKIRENLKRH